MDGTLGAESKPQERAGNGQEAQSVFSQGLRPRDLVNQSVGDVGNEDRVSLEGSVHFFAKWERWFIPRETISTKSGCLVKNGPV